MDNHSTNIYYSAGQKYALHHIGLIKKSSAPVLVTDDQTFQYRPDPAFVGDPQARAAGIDATWDAHDRRFQTSIRAPADITSQLTGADG